MNLKYPVYISPLCRWLMTAAILSIIISIFNRIILDVYMLPFLPITYLISILIIRPDNAIFKSITCSIFHIIIFCRYIIIPILWSTQEKYSGLVVSHPDYNQAIILMSYELIVLSIVYKIIIKNKERIVDNVKIKKYVLSSVVFFFILIWIWVFISNGEYRSSFLSFSISNREDLGLADGEFLSDSKKSILSGPLKVFTPLGLMALTVYVCFIIKKYYKEKKIGLFLITVICFLYVIRTSLGIASISRWNLVLGFLIGATILISLYGQYSRKIKKISIVLIIASILIGSMVKLFITKSTNSTLDETTTYYTSAENFDEYFAGIGPVANGIRVLEIHHDERSFSRMFVDCFTTVPYFTKFFGLSDISPTEPLYHKTTGWRQLIMPNITISLFQFGWIFSPIYSVLLLCLSVYFETRYKRSTELLEKLFLLKIVFWTSLFMILNVIIINSNIVPYIIGYFLLKIRKIIKLPTI